MYCCKIGCDKTAVWAIYGPVGYITHSCEDDVYELAGLGKRTVHRINEDDSIDDTPSWDFESED